MKESHRVSKASETEEGYKQKFIASSIESIRDRRRVQAKVHRESLKRTDSSITLKSRMQMVYVLSTQKGLGVQQKTQ